jgi:hypothetical protein
VGLVYLDNKSEAKYTSSSSVYLCGRRLSWNLGLPHEHSIASISSFGTRLQSGGEAAGGSGSENVAQVVTCDLVDWISSMAAHM